MNKDKNVDYTRRCFHIESFGQWNVKFPLEGLLNGHYDFDKFFEMRTNFDEASYAEDDDPVLTVYWDVNAANVLPSPTANPAPVEPANLGAVLCRGNEVLLAIHVETPWTLEQTEPFRRACDALDVPYLVIPADIRAGIDYHGYTNDPELAEALETPEEVFEGKHNRLFAAKHLCEMEERDRETDEMMMWRGEWAIRHLRGVSQWLREWEFTVHPRLYTELVQKKPIGPGVAVRRQLMPKDTWGYLRPLQEAGLVKLSQDEEWREGLREDAAEKGENSFEAMELRLMGDEPDVCELTGQGRAAGLLWGQAGGNDLGLYCTAEAYPRIMKLLAGDGARG